MDSKSMIARWFDDHRWLARVLVLFVALGATYSIATPIFEAGDELWHYPFVQHLATGHGLPIQDPNVKTWWEQEGGQPPLYYALSALATFWIDTRDLPDRLWRNPEAKIGIPLVYGNKNMIVHTSAESFPWQNTTLAVHLIRFLSILFSTITVALTYFLALEIFNSQSSNVRAQDDEALAAIAAAFVAFNPMFIFISASVNNDNLATMLATLSLLLITQLITRGATLKRFIVLGVVLGLGALAKVSSLGLLVVAGIVFLYLLWKAGQADKATRGHGEIHHVFGSPHFLVGMIICAGIVVVIAFWWYVRNWILYGDPLAFNVWVQIAGGRPTPATLATLFDEFQSFRISFWGNFGGVNLIAPDRVYLVLDVFTVLAAIGLLIGVIRRTLPRLLALPALWLVIISLSLVRWTWLTMASQGRLIFPAIGAVAILLACGLNQFSVLDSRSAEDNDPRFLHFVSRFTDLALAIFLFGFSVLTPFSIITPAYVLPSRFADDTIVPSKTLITYDGQAELVGYNLPQKSIQPGSEFPLTLYWRTASRIDEDLSVGISVLDAADKKVSQWNAFPGGGAYPTRVWQPGEVIEDRYHVAISPDAQPGTGKIIVSLFRRAPLETLTAHDPHGNEITPIITQIEIVAY